MISGKVGLSSGVIFITIIFCLGVGVRSNENRTRLWWKDPLVPLKELQGRFDIRSITLTGGRFAQIIHLSFSKIFIGIYLISPTFYKCGGVSSSYDEWKSQCGVNYTADPPYDVEKSAEEATSLAKAGKLDPLENLKHQRLWIFTTTNSELSDFDLCFRTLNIYEPLLASPTQIGTRVWTGGVFKELDKKFSHTRRQFEAFSFILPNKKIRWPKGVTVVARLSKFSQREFFEGDESIHHFAEEGFVYIPIKCRFNREKCFLHLYIHPCVENDAIEEGNIVKTKIRSMAERNNIIVVFPQIKPTSEKGGYNGCFDGFGYTGKDYATKDGVQVRIIRNMLESMLGSVVN